MREQSRVETVSGREYEPGPKSVLLRSEDCVMCVLLTCAVSGRCSAA